MRGKMPRKYGQTRSCLFLTRVIKMEIRVKIAEKKGSEAVFTISRLYRMKEKMWEKISLQVFFSQNNESLDETSSLPMEENTEE